MFRSTNSLLWVLFFFLIFTVQVHPYWSWKSCNEIGVNVCFEQWTISLRNIKDVNFDFENCVKSNHKINWIVVVLRAVKWTWSIVKLIIALEQMKNGWKTVQKRFDCDFHQSVLCSICNFSYFCDDFILFFNPIFNRFNKK